MPVSNVNGDSPCTFRTYSHAANAVPDCTIWQVLRATMTHPSLFKAVEIGELGLRERFVEGGLVCSNPTSHLLDEAKRLFPGRQVGCIISIGAGHARTMTIPRSNWVKRALWIGRPTTRALKAAHGIATDNERVADEISKRFAATRDVYYRMNVSQGVQGIKVSQWERLDEVVARTRAYMRQVENNRTLDAMVGAMHKQNSVVDTHPFGEAFVDEMYLVGLTTFAFKMIGSPFPRSHLPLV
jgi:predicted acylesterase/phospholipase RssA